MTAADKPRTAFELAYDAVYGPKETHVEPDDTLFPIHRYLPGKTRKPRELNPYKLWTYCFDFVKRDCVTTDWSKATCPKCLRYAPSTTAAPAPAVVPPTPVPTPITTPQTTKRIFLPCYREHGVWWHGSHLLVGCACCHREVDGLGRCGKGHPEKCKPCTLRAERIRYLRT